MSWQPPGDAGQTLIPGLYGYTDLHLIAHGSTAMVFRATQTRLNRTVAIKVLLVDEVMTTQANVARELETTVALSSQPHIVSIIDTGVTDDGSPYIVMEYCEGGSYAQILKRRGPLPLGEVLEVGVKIGEALHAAHGVGIVHRDVKPPNILRSRFGPALADFGIARAADDGGAATSTLDKLTPHHASPEALLRGAQSGLSDLYSLASTMWNLIVGRPPFHDPKLSRQDPIAFRERVLTQPMPRLPRERVPEWLQRELARAMAKAPEDRHESAGAFAEVLRDHVARKRASPRTPRQPSAPERHSGERAPAGVDPDLPTQWVSNGPPLRPALTPPPWQQPPNSSAIPWQSPPGRGQQSPEGNRQPSTQPAERPSAPREPAGAVASAPRAERALPGPVPSADADAAKPPSRAKAVALMSAIGVLFGTVIVGATAWLGDEAPRQDPSPSPSPAAPLTEKDAPLDVRIEDHTSSVRLSWRHGRTEQAPKIVTGELTADRTSRRFGEVQAGVTTTTINGLNAKLDYCFVVVAVHPGPVMAPSQPVCTRRLAGATGAPPTR